MRLLLVLVLLCTAILVSVAESVSSGTYVSSPQFASLSPDELIETVNELHDDVNHLSDPSESTDSSQLETSAQPVQKQKKRASTKKIQKKSTAKARSKAGASVAARALTSAKVARVQRIKQEIEKRDMHRYKRGHKTEITFEDEAPAQSHSLLQAEEMVSALEQSLGFDPNSLPAPSFAFAELGSKHKSKNKNKAKRQAASHSAYFAPPEVAQALTPYSFPSPTEMSAFMPPQPVQQAQAPQPVESQQSDTELAMNLMFNLLQQQQTQKSAHNIMFQMQNMIAQRKAGSAAAQQQQQRRAMGMFGAAPTFGPTPATIADATLGQYPVPAAMMQQQQAAMALGMNIPGQIIPPAAMQQQNPFAGLHP